MRSTFLLMMVTIITISANAQEDGIKFFHGTFQEALDKAEQENKKLFVDVYTSWCGPCKKMSKTVFTQAEVGDFFNENFISFKIDAEKGEGPTIREKYSVSGYPTLMFLTPDGEVVKKMTSSLDAPALIAFGKSVLTVNDNFEELKAKYKQNELGKDELFQYLIHLKSRELSKEIEEVFNKYFVLAAEDQISETLLNMIPEYGTQSDSEAFQYLLKNRERFNKVIGVEKVTKCITDVYLGEFRYTRFKTEEEYRSAKKVLKTRVDVDKELSLSLDNHYYYTSQNEEKYIETAGELVKVYEKNKDDMEISHILGSLKWLKQHDSYLKLEEWGLLAIRINNSFINNAQMGLVYAALKDESKSEEYFNKAEEIGKSTKNPYLERLPMLREMAQSMLK